ncbi:MAG: DUF5694 domain-containing protein [Treponema sp.]
MINKKTFLLLILLFGLTFLHAKKTELLVIGTIHQYHEDNSNYSYQDVLNIVHTYNPDVICVEIPEFYFRKQAYLKEMMLACIYGFDHNKKVYPIDWFQLSGNPRIEREEYMKTDSYIINEAEEKRKKQASQIIEDFEKKYSNYIAENKAYSFFNGKEYNDYIRESYNIMISVYGDSPMNLYSESRNARMASFIDEVIKENNEKKIIVLTGAEHKYYFDDFFSKQGDVNLIQLEDILPLKKAKKTKNLTAFMDRNIAKGYYASTDNFTIDTMYGNAIIPLVHGPDMDEKPTIILKENIKKASSILHEWKKDNPNSVYLQFETAWIHFLKNDYKTAIKISDNIREHLDEVPAGMEVFLGIFYWRNLGFCYDMIGKRDKAINAYKECRKLCTQFNINEDKAKKIYKNFEMVPYKK